jgi:EAL domain-containing protein (putative c-di-GMP-specific phosphodiesterase class I)
MILPIGEWVLRTAISQARKWIDNDQPPMIIAINISAVQFRHPNLPNLITSILEEAKFPPQYLEIELTESIAMHDPQVAINTMNDLHERGIQMSIDDFGTGYSSLSYLKKFKVYKLKIDQSFVHDIGTNSEDKAIVNAIINMARSLDLQTIAEGVETLEQLEYLREQGCDEIQGYYYSKPLSPKEFEKFFRSLYNTL